jgi:hypothetical protein
MSALCIYCFSGQRVACPFPRVLTLHPPVPHLQPMQEHEQSETKKGATCRHAPLHTLPLTPSSIHGSRGFSSVLYHGPPECLHPPPDGTRCVRRWVWHLHTSFDPSPFRCHLPLNLSAGTDLHQTRHPARFTGPDGYPQRCTSIAIIWTHGLPSEDESTGITTLFMSTSSKLEHWPLEVSRER